MRTSNNCIVEVKSALWQKIAASIVFAVLSGGSAIGILQTLFPVILSNASVERESNPERCLTLVGLLVIFAMGFYIWWSSLHYRLCADEEGIMQSDGLRTVRVSWSEVGSYKWRVRRGTSDRYVETVLMGHDGRIIFQPFAHTITSDKAIMRTRKDFWQFVVTRCSERGDFT